jgi:uncharacterized phage protein gp47/JayE
VATLAAQITPDGISAPDYADTYRELQNGYWSIYGTDADLDEDSQDGEFIAIFAQAIYDLNQLVIADYNSRSPAFAQGAGLASLVKINGLSKKVPSNSSAVVRLVGQTGQTVNGGLVGDNAGLKTQWALPPSVTFPDAGQIDVTAVCTSEGAVSAAPGTLTVILTPTLGWQTVTNAESAAPGQPVESDPALRTRQSESTALAAQTITEAIFAAVDAVPGVSRIKLYENDTDATDGDGLPAHSISIVALGGDAQTIATTIARQKAGTGTHGSISELVVDQNGVPTTINFNPLSLVPISIAITVKPLTGYSSAIGDSIKQAAAAFVNGLDIGEDSYLVRLYSPANLGGVGDGAKFIITGITQARDANPLTAADVALAYDEAATCIVDNVTITVVA